MSKIIELRNKRNTLWEQTKAFLEEHRDANGLVEASAVEQYNKMASDVKALGDEIARLEDQMEMDAKLAAATSAPVHADPKPGQRKANVRPTATAEYGEAFWNMMRGHSSPEVRDALSVGVDQNGGYTVPDEFERQLIQGLEENNIFRSLAHVMRTNSGSRIIPLATDNGTASWIEEGTAIQESDMSFAQETLSAYKLGCMVKVSNELLNDSAFDIAAYIAQRFGVVRTYGAVPREQRHPRVIVRMRQNRPHNAVFAQTPAEQIDPGCIHVVPRGKIHDRGVDGLHGAGVEIDRLRRTEDQQISPRGVRDAALELLA